MATNFTKHIRGLRIKSNEELFEVLRDLKNCVVNETGKNVLETAAARLKVHIDLDDTLKDKELEEITTAISKEVKLGEVVKEVKVASNWWNSDVLGNSTNRKSNLLSVRDDGRYITPGTYYADESVIDEDDDSPQSAPNDPEHYKLTMERMRTVMDTLRTAR